MSYASARIHFAFSAIILVAISGCVSPRAVPEPPGGAKIELPPVRPAGSDSTPKAYERAASIALQQVGVPYRYGGADPGGFDCSGLVYFSYAEAGIAMPRTTGRLWSSLAPVSVADLVAGDVVFFDIAGKVSHVGLYLGGGRFVHAPSSGRTVTVARLDQPFYRDALVRGGRPKRSR